VTRSFEEEQQSHNGAGSTVLGCCTMMVADVGVSIDDDAKCNNDDVATWLSPRDVCVCAALRTAELAGDDDTPQLSVTASSKQLPSATTIPSTSNILESINVNN